MFGLSFWRHPFTAEDPLMSKWCNGYFFFQICSNEETNSFRSSMVWGWVHFQQITFFGLTISWKQPLLYRRLLHALKQLFQKTSICPIGLLAQNFKQWDITLMPSSPCETIATTWTEWLIQQYTFQAPPHMLQMDSTRMKLMHDYNLSINCCFNFFLLIGHVRRNRYPKFNCRKCPPGTIWG